MALTIAIDGPVGAGKSTIASAVADALNILHLDTGAMYRALALKALREEIDPWNTVACEALCLRTAIEVRLMCGGQQTLLDGEDVTGLIRTPEVSTAASAISQAAGVRAHMVALQRQYAMQSDMVLDGRDIGTRVLPDASFKFFLAAPADVRARRRYQELSAAGVTCRYEDVLSDLIARDRRDSERAVDPLRQATDAIVIDTADMAPPQVLNTLLTIIREEKT